MNPRQLPSALKASSLLLATVLVGCGVSSPIKNINESESEFSDDPAKRLKPLKGNPDIYRIYDRAASGFVSIGATREGLEERARKFCDDRQQSMRVLESEQSNPPYILGNFPRMELIFMCEKSVGASKTGTMNDKLGHLNELKKLRDNGTLTASEFEAEKRKILSTP